MIPTAEQILSNLPITLLAWTATTLCWGVYIHVTMNKIIAFADQYKGGARTSDKTNVTFIMLINAILIAFLLMHPVLSNLSDAIVVVNVFYDAYLTALTRTACRWWKTRFQFVNPSDEHILT